jgi:hypothetical protein
VKAKVKVEVEDEVGPIHVRRFGIGPEPDALVKSQKAKAKAQSARGGRHLPVVTGSWATHGFTDSAFSVLQACRIVVSAKMLLFSASVLRPFGS